MCKGSLFGYKASLWVCIRRCCLGITHRCACIGHRRVCTKRCCMCVNKAYLSEIIMHLLCVRCRFCIRYPSMCVKVLCISRIFADIFSRIGCVYELGCL